MTTTSHEPPTDEQLIRRGRGEAFAALRRDPSLVEVVLDSALVDDRWDRQTEERADYLARLLLVTNTDPRPLTLQLERKIGADAEDQSISHLPRDVLLRLAVRGDRRASAGLRQALMSGGPPSQAWVMLVDLVWDARVPDLVDELPQLVSGRLGQGHDRQDLLPALAESARKREARNTGRPRSPQADLCDADDAALVAAVRAGEPDRWRSLAELGRRGRTALVVELASDTSLRDRNFTFLPGLSSALAALSESRHSAAVREAALAWTCGDDEYLRAEGVTVLAKVGDVDDVPTLLRGWDEAVGDGSWCASENIAEAFERLLVVEAAPRLAAAHDLTPHSYARPFFLRALARLSPPDAEPLLAAALLDAEPRQRILAAERGPLTASTLAVLAALADDVHEDDAVRAAAAKRLGRPDPETAPSGREV